MKKLKGIAYLSVLTHGVYSDFSDAYRDAENYCLFMGIKFLPCKHVQTVFLWLNLDKYFDCYGIPS